MENKRINKGDILIAKPTLNNDIFNRSVVIITEHSEKGSVGFILNKSSNIPLHIFVSQMNSDSIVYEGGPVDKKTYIICILVQILFARVKKLPKIFIGPEITKMSERRLIWEK